MTMMALAIGATSLALLMVLIWMISLSLRKQRLENERKEREAAYRKAVARAREQERQERIYKAENGDVPTILFLAKEAERTNLKEALHWYKKGALLDNVNAMYGTLRIMEKMGDDLIMREQANFWRTAIAATSGDNQARFQTGRAFIHGRGVDRDVTKGQKLVEKAAREGNLEAMSYMGHWSSSQENMHSNDDEAFKWFQRAAKHNSIQGQIELGHCYLHGVGTPATHVKACYWYERAAEQGSAEGMFYAGEAWRGTSKLGDALAYIWLFLSTEFGYERARNARDQAASAIGVDIVVGLQSVAKPMKKKIEMGAVNKHAVIKALNKLYKRPTYFPHIEATPTEPSQAATHDVPDTVNDSAVPVSELPAPPDYSKPFG